MTSDQNADPQKRPVDSDNASRGWVLTFGLYLVVLNLIMLYFLITLWPPQLPLKPESVELRLVPGVRPLLVGMETRFLLLVAVAGGLGSFIHLATSFADFLGNRQLKMSWAWWYILRPFIGMALALIVYFTARAGLVGGTSGAETLSPYGMASLAGLAGLFSKQATDKLREVFENLFKTERPPRADALKQPNGLESPGEPPE
jgi:hypothetical protein